MQRNQRKTYLLVANLVGDGISLNSLLLGDTDKLLLKGTRSIGSVKVEDSLFRVDVEEFGDVAVIGEGG